MLLLWAVGRRQSKSRAGAVSVGVGATPRPTALPHTASASASLAREFFNQDIAKWRKHLHRSRLWQFHDPSQMALGVPPSTLDRPAGRTPVSASMCNRNAYAALLYAMKPRLTIAVSSQSGLADRLAGLQGLVKLDVDRAALREDLCKMASGGEGRVLIVDRADLPDDPTSYIEQLLCEDDPPSLVVVADGSNPLDRTRMLAAGATQVVSSTGTDDHLENTLEGIAQRESGGGGSGPEIRGNQATAHLSDFVSRSRSMLRFVETIEKVADAECSLLITGETGVGKERVARAVHETSQRGGPFVGVNCGAVPEALLESQLFGHERGAFTGADSLHKGYFEQANGGVIFLDEVGEIPLHLQVKLLTVLQRFEVQRLGSEKTIPVDVRVIAATNRDLKKEMREGRFREDLYYRLNVIHLPIPPLRNRVEDIPDLVGGLVHFFRCDLVKTEVESISRAGLEALLAYHWPGNIRELINVIERAMILGDGPDLGVNDLPADIVQTGRGPQVDPGVVGPVPPDEPDDWRSLSLKEIREAAAASRGADLPRHVAPRSCGSHERGREAGQDRNSIAVRQDETPRSEEGRLQEPRFERRGSGRRDGVARTVGASQARDVRVRIHPRRRPSLVRRGRVAHQAQARSRRTNANRLGHPERCRNGPGRARSLRARGSNPKALTTGTRRSAARRASMSAGSCRTARRSASRCPR